MNIAEAIKKFGAYGEMEVVSHLSSESGRHMYWDGTGWVVKESYSGEHLYEGPSEEEALATMLEE